MTTPIIITNGMESLSCKQVGIRLGLRTQLIRRWYNDYKIRTFEGMEKRQSLGVTSGNHTATKLYETYFGRLTVKQASLITVELWGKENSTTDTAIKGRIKVYGEKSIAVFIPKAKNSYHFQQLLFYVGVIDKVIPKQTGTPNTGTKTKTSINRTKVCIKNRNKCIRYNARVDAVAFDDDLPKQCILTGVECANYEFI